MVYVEPSTFSENMGLRINNDFRSITPAILRRVEQSFKHILQLCIQEYGGTYFIRFSLAAFIEHSLLLLPLLASTVLGFPFAPTLEPNHKGAFITSDSWYEMLKYGKFNRVPVMIGYAANESLFFSRLVTGMLPIFIGFEIDPGLYAPSALSKLSLQESQKIGKMVRKFYFGESGGIAISDLGKAFKYFNSEFFTRPVRKSALLMSEYVPVYFYQFSYMGPTGYNGLASWAKYEKRKGVRHTEMLYYLFNKLDNYSSDDEDVIVRKRLVQLWANFAKYSDPTPSRDILLHNVLWPEISTMDEHQMQYVDINKTLTIRQYSHEKLDIDFWNNIFMNYSKSPLTNFR